MTEREAVERALQHETRMLQRQQLLKRLWRLDESAHKTDPKANEAVRKQPL
jgi:hypothetical protein